MSTPLLFIVFPLLISVLLLTIQKKKRLVLILGILTCGILALLAIFQEFGEVLKIGPISIELNPSMLIFGRYFILVNSDRFFLSLVFISSALWFGAAEITGTPTKFISLGLAITSILTAALAVEPFIYSAILVEVAAIIAIPLTMQTGKPVGRGVIRFLIFQSLAMPLVLFGGWLLGGIQASPSDVTRLSQAAIFLGTGFAFWLAVFPFQSWVPLFTQEVNPLIAGFILGLFPIVTLFIMMDFISGLVWLRESQFLAPILRSVGIIMIVTAGVWTAFENDARRIFGYAVLLESGFSFVTISFQTALGVKTLFLSLIPRLVGLSVFGLALALILIYGFKPTFEGMKGLVRKLPFASIAFTLSLLSIIGIPLLAGFPIRLGTLEQLALTNSAGVAWCLIGIAGFFLAVMRFFASFIRPVYDTWRATETLPQIIFLLIGIFALLLFGLLPNFLGGVTASYFSNLPILR